MGVRRAPLTWALGIGLTLLFVSERVLDARPAARVVTTGAGLLVLVAVAALRVRAWRDARGDERVVARVFALASIGCAVAALLLLLGTEDAVRLLELDFETVIAESRFRRGLLSAGTITLVVSLLPAVAGEWALSFRPSGFRTGRADVLRVGQVSAGALGVALAGSFLMLGGYLTSVHDRTLDASYFKTSSPGEAVQGIVGSMGEPLRVLLFFPPVDPVKDEVLSYVRQLAAATGGVEIEEIDRLAEPGRAQEHGVAEDGTVVFVRGDRTARLGLPTDLSAARARLRVLDGEVQRVLLELQRERRVAYLTVGHGELNDRLQGEIPEASRRARDEFGPTDGDERLGALRRLLQLLGYEVRDLGLQTGLGSAVPRDAAVLLSVGPRRPFLPEEMAVVRTYLRGGGSLLLALDPGTGFDLGPLRPDLGVDFRPVMLADEERHLNQTGGAADRRLIVTNRISAHASVSTASRRGVGSGIALVEAGSLTEVEPPVGVRRRFVVESLGSTFVDEDGDLSFDQGSEARGVVPLVAAIEADSTAEAAGMRALVLADADLFSDPVLLSLGMNAAVVADGIRWLGREESFGGGTVSEADVPIVHTREENVVWFWAIILGAPALVLLAGLTRVLHPRLQRRSAA